MKSSKYSIRVVPDDFYAESFSSGYVVLERDGFEIERRDIDYWGKNVRELRNMASDLNSTEGHPLACGCIMCR